MNTTITSNGLPVLPQATGTQGGASSQDAGAAAKPTVAGPAADSLKLTDSARAITQASQGDKAGPINQQKVDQIRAAVANGSYKPDPAKIADRLISLNSQLDGK